jgi:hypothetical protein
MDIGALLILLAILLMMAAYLTQPFLTPRRRRVTMEERRYSSLMAEYERVLSALQELDFDHRLGKIPEEEYPLLRAELLKKGTTLLQDWRPGASAFPMPRRNRGWRLPWPNAAHNAPRSRAPA